MDTYADDLAALVQALDLKDAIHVGHSTGGGEVARYIGRHGTTRVSKVVLISAITPLMLQTPANPGGLPLKVFDDIRAGVLKDRSQFFKDLSVPFFGANRAGAAVSQGVLDTFWLLGMQAGLKNAYDCIKVFSETDLTEDLKKIDVPTLIVHGDDDQIVPIAASALLSAKIVKQATLKIYEGAGHGLPTTLKDRLNADLLEFCRAGAAVAAVRAAMIHYQDRWAVVTGASSGFGRGLAARLGDRGMSLVLTGRNKFRLEEAANQIRRAAPRVKVETVTADLSTGPGVSALLAHIGDRPIEVLINNAGFGSYGPFAEADPDRESDEVAVDVNAVITLARAFLPGMLARRSGGILNVASTAAFQPTPYRRCTEQVRHLCCRLAGPCGPRREGPAWRSPRYVQVRPAQVSSTRLAPMWPIRRCTTGSPSRSP